MKASADMIGCGYALCHWFERSPGQCKPPNHVRCAARSLPGMVRASTAQGVVLEKSRVGGIHGNNDEHSSGIGL
jgi:hypothetical protein